MYSSDLDTKYSTLIDELKALNYKFSTFINGPNGETVPTSNGPIKTLTSIVSDITKIKYIQKIIDHRLYSDMIDDQLNISTGLLVRIWGDLTEVNGIYQKNTDDTFTKINYQALFGDDGGKLLYGSIDPDQSVGTDGDFYINTSSSFLFGPKLTVWPTGVSLVGPKGDSSTGTGSSSNIFQKEAGVTLSGHRAVLLDMNNTAIYASNDMTAFGIRVLGITTTAAILGTDVNIQTAGEIIEPTWNWDVTKPIYLGLDGYLTQTPPSSGFVLIVGFPSSSTSIIVDIRDPIILS